MKYKILLFDADETLLDFSKAERSALKNAFSSVGIIPTEELCDKFSEINNNLWKLFEKGEIEKTEIIKRRFLKTFEFFKIPYTPEFGIEAFYQEALSKEHELIPHAEEVCRTLSKTYSMYIITNGLYVTQKRRLSDSGLLPYFDGYFVSEKVGYQKPSKEYFDEVLKSIGSPSRKDILIIGDSCSSDINGGHVSGIDTCWYNPKNLAMTAIKAPTYTISNLSELYNIL